MASILNFYTKISVDKTCGEIQKILVRHGASKVSFDYEGQIPVNITFSSPFKDTIVFFSLPCRVDGVMRICKSKGTPVGSDQGRRIGWRTIKGWIEAQMSLVEQGMAELPEVFLPYGVTKSGERLYDYLKRIDNDNLLLID